MKSNKSNKEWELLVNQYKDSKLSIIKFSNENNIKPSTFAYWVKKSKQTDSKSLTKLVKIKKPINPEQKMILSYGGIVIEISNNISTEVITSIINSIREIR